MTGLPRGWVWTTLGEVAGYTNGRGFRKSEWVSSGRPIIRIQNLTGSGTSFNYFDGELDARHIVKPNDLLVSWAATLSVHRWRGPHEGALNQHIFKVEPRSAVNSRYLEHVLRFALNDMYLSAHGSGMVHITRSKFESTRVPLPPLAEQSRIVGVLDDYLSRLDAADTDLAAAQTKASALRARAVEVAIESSPGNDGHSAAERLLHIVELRSGLATKRRGSASPPAYQLDLPPGWKTASVDELCWQIQYGTSTKTHETASAADIPVLRMGNIQDGGIDVGSLKYISEDDPSVGGLILEPGDLLFNRTNSAELVGKTAVFEGQPPRATFASYLIRCATVPRVSAQWISLIANSSIGRRYIESVMSQQVGQANVNGTKLAAMPIPITTAATEARLLEEILESRESAARLTESVGSALRRSMTLRRSLLRAAFNGELVDQDPNDEPADVALARIRNQPKPTRKQTASRATSATT